MVGSESSRSGSGQLSSLWRRDLPPDQFYPAFLAEVAARLTAACGTLWIVRRDGTLRPDYQLNPERIEWEGPSRQHARDALLNNILTTGQATLVPPQSAADADRYAGAAANLTDHVFIAAPIQAEQRPRGLIEVLLRDDVGPTTLRGCLRTLVQLAGRAGHYLEQRRRQQQQLRPPPWEELESLHRSLGLRQTARAIVDAGCRIVGCDRISLTWRSGETHQVLAVSGRERLDAGSLWVRQLVALSRAACRSGQVVWPDAADPPLVPELRREVESYLCGSPATALAIVPLHWSDAAVPGEPFATLIIEQFDDEALPQAARERILTLASHGRTALANAADHEGLFLMPLWRACGNFLKTA